MPDTIIGSEGTATSSQSGDTTVTGQTTTNTPSSVTDSEKIQKDQNAKIFSGGFNEGATRRDTHWHSVFQQYGFQGEPSEDNIKDWLSQKVTASKTTDKKWEEERQQHARVVKDLEDKYKTKESELVQYRTDSVLGSAFSRFNLSMSPDEAIALFKLHHKVELTEQGVRVYNKAGELMRDDSYLKVLTPQEVVEKFVKERPYLEKAVTRVTDNGGDRTGMMMDSDGLKNMSDGDKMKVVTEMLRPQHRN